METCPGSLPTAVSVLHLYACGQNGVHVLLKPLSGETVAGNAIEKHSAQLGALFVDGCLVAHQLQVVGCRQTAGAASDDGDPLSGGRSAGRRRHNARIVDSRQLNAADIDSVVNHIAAAAGLGRGARRPWAQAWERCPSIRRTASA